ncbi:MAG: creatininase family protein, partial [Spirochaetota bacterium]
LPLGADGLQAQGFFVQLAERAGGIVLPMLYLGPDTHKREKGRDYYGMDFEGADGPKPVQLTGSAYWVSEHDFRVILNCILKQLKRVGFRIVLAHGHGPSTEFFIRHRLTWKNEYGLETFTCQREDETDGPGIQTDHAGANETSLVMALRPELVRLENLPSDLRVWPLAIKGEDPRTVASAEMGRQAIALNVERLSKILKRALSRLKSESVLINK